MKKLVGLLLMFLICSVSFAMPISVGSGQDWAGVRIEWLDGFTAEFLVNYNGTMTGMGLLDTIASETTLIITKQDFGFGEFVDGLAFAGHSNIGFGGDENWWHYSTKNVGQIDWTSSWVGAGERTVNSGDWDGWSYGHNIPEPITAIIFGFGMIALRRKTAK